MYQSLDKVGASYTLSLLVYNTEAVKDRTLLLGYAAVQKALSKVWVYI